nr:zinc finger, CCHC-type [Tanacetum cinerariifolium]
MILQVASCNSAKEIWEALQTRHIETESGKKNVFLLVDDCTMYMRVYFLKSKDEAFETFKEFKLKVENEVGKKLKSFRTDRGGEITSREFTRYYKENGILRQLTAPYSPQQNGIVERRNRLKKYQKRTKSDQNRTKTRSVAKPGKVKSSYSGLSKKKLNKMQKEGPEMQTRAKSIKALKEERKEEGQKCNFVKVTSGRPILPKY